MPPILSRPRSHDIPHPGDPTPSRKVTRPPRPDCNATNNPADQHHSARGHESVSGSDAPCSPGRALRRPHAWGCTRPPKHRSSREQTHPERKQQTDDTDHDSRHDRIPRLPVDTAYCHQDRVGHASRVHTRARSPNCRGARLAHQASRLGRPPPPPQPGASRRPRRGYRARLTQPGAQGTLATVPERASANDETGVSQIAGSGIHTDGNSSARGGRP